MLDSKLAVLGGKPAFQEKIYMTRPTVPGIDELNPLIKDVLGSRWLTNDGKYVRELEKKLRTFLNNEYCSLCCNGTIGLQLSIQALELSGEVITTPFTFAATPNVLAVSKITPVFCDINPKTYNLEPENIKPLITRKTTAIMPVHTFGNPCNVKKIETIASAYNLKIIYDAASAFGVKIGQNSISRYGDASVFSFHSTKLFNTLEGGTVCCKNKQLHKKIKDLRNFGIRSEEEVIAPGINAKMNEIQAVFGIINLKKINHEIKQRKKLYQIYKSKLKQIPGIYFQSINSDITYNYSILSIEIDASEFGLTRDEVYLCMRKEGIIVRKYFWPLTSNYPFYKKLPSADKKLLPNANRVSTRTLTLPLYGDIGEEQLNKIIKIVSTIHENASKIKKKLN